MPAITISGNLPNCTREAILSGGICTPVVVACPVDKVVIAENTSGCGSLSTKIVIQSPEANTLYTLRDNQDNSVVAGPSPGSDGLSTGTISKTTTYNVLARNVSTGCEVVMITKPIVTINPLPLDKTIVAENAVACGSLSTKIIIQSPEASVLYTLRDNQDNSVVAGPSPGLEGLSTGAINKTTVYNVLARNSVTGCEMIMSIKPVVTINLLPLDKTIVAENAVACGSLSTKIIIQSPEANVQYTLRDNQDNSLIAGPSPGSEGFNTGAISKTTTYNVLARNVSTGCEVVMITKPIVTINPLPLDKTIVAENAVACGSLSTKIIIQSPEASVLYTLRDNQDNSVVAGPSPGSEGLNTGAISKTTTYNVLARNISTGCEVVMSTKPVITINPFPLDKTVVAESDSVMAGAGTNILVQEGELNVLYTLRKDGDNLIVSGPMLSPPILSTGNIFETTTFNVLASRENCEKVLSTRVTVTVVVPTIVTGDTVSIATSLTFYPNPSNGEFQIRFPSDHTGQYQLSLHDLAGTLVQERSIESLDEFHTAQMDLKPLSAGTYFISIIGSGGISMRKKLVITN